MPLKRPALTEEMFRKYAIPGHYHPVGVGDLQREQVRGDQKTGLRSLFDRLAMFGSRVGRRGCLTNRPRTGEHVALKVLRTDSTKARNQPDEAELIQTVNSASRTQAYREVAGQL